MFNSDNKNPYYNYDQPFSSPLPRRPLENNSIFHKNRKVSETLKKVDKVVGNLREWSEDTFMISRQFITETVGNVASTLEENLLKSINDVRQHQINTRNLFQSLKGYNTAVVNMQQSQAEFHKVLVLTEGYETKLSSILRTCAQYTNELAHNASSHFDELSSVLNSLDTLGDKVIEDTIMTIQKFEKSRLRFDAYKSELINIKEKKGGKSDKMSKLIEKTETFKEDFESLKNDVITKIKILEENRMAILDKALRGYYGSLRRYYVKCMAATEKSKLAVEDAPLLPPTFPF